MSKTSKAEVEAKPASAFAEPYGPGPQDNWFRQPAQSIARIEVAGEPPESVALDVVLRIGPSAYDLGPRARAMLAGVRAAERDLEASGGAFTLEQVREVLHGVSRQRIEQRVRDGSLLAVPGPSNHRRYPVAQFGNDGEVVAGLSEVTGALPTKNPWAILNFLVTPDAALDGRRPIDLLHGNEVAPVVAAARSVGDAGR